MPHLDQDAILGIVDALTSAGLVRIDVLDGLLSQIHPAYVATLPQDMHPLSRLMRQLDDLNRTDRLEDGSVPLQTWLKNAIPYTAGKQAARDVLSHALARVSAGASAAGLAKDLRGGLPGRHERIVLDNDLLPVAFLERGAEAARAVARLVVTRYDDQRESRRHGAPRRYLGTGWLLTPDLLITNHHVVNAREDDEPDASREDLDLQARGTAIELDYDADRAAPSVEAVAGLEAFSSLRGPLDYAILRLARRLDRRPLPVVPTPMEWPPDTDARLAVNIIQHPTGSPKMVACRNNLVARVDGAQIYYFTDTMAGSSGSPVLDDEWRAVALHKKWDYVTGVRFQGRDTAWVNVGTAMNAILDDLRTSGRAALLREILGG